MPIQNRRAVAFDIVTSVFGAAASIRALNQLLVATRKAQARNNEFLAPFQRQRPALEGYADGLRKVAFGLGQVAVAGLAARQLVFTMRELIRVGFEWNKVLEIGALGIATIAVSLREYSDAAGKVTDVQKALDLATVDANRQIRLLRVAGLQTAATTRQLISAYQEAVGAGAAYGLTLDQIRHLTVLTTLASLQLGLPLHQINQEIRALLSGDIDRNARVAKALAITPEDVHNAQKRNELFGFLFSKLGVFGDAGDRAQRTWAVVVSNLQEAVETFAGIAVVPGFEQLRDDLLELSQVFFDFNTAEIAPDFQGALFAIQVATKEVTQRVSDLVRGAVVLGRELSRAFADPQRLGQFQVLLRQIGDITASFVRLVFQLIQVGVGFVDALVASGAFVTGMRAAAEVLDVLTDALKVVGRVVTPLVKQIGPLVAALIAFRLVRAAIAPVVTFLVGLATATAVAVARLRQLAVDFGILSISGASAAGTTRGMVTQVERLLVVLAALVRELLLVTGGMHAVRAAAVSAGAQLANMGRATAAAGTAATASRLSWGALLTRFGGVAGVAITVISAIGAIIAVMQGLKAATDAATEAERDRQDIGKRLADEAATRNIEALTDQYITLAGEIANAEERNKTASKETQEANKILVEKARAQLVLLGQDLEKLGVTAFSGVGESVAGAIEAATTVAQESFDRVRTGVDSIAAKMKAVEDSGAVLRRELDRLGAQFTQDSAAAEATIRARTRGVPRFGLTPTRAGAAFGPTPAQRDALEAGQRRINDLSKESSELTKEQTATTLALNEEIERSVRLRQRIADLEQKGTSTGKPQDTVDPAEVLRKLKEKFQVLNIAATEEERRIGAQFQAVLEGIERSLQLGELTLEQATDKYATTLEQRRDRIQAVWQALLDNKDLQALFAEDPSVLQGLKRQFDAANNEFIRDSAQLANRTQDFGFELHRKLVGMIETALEQAPLADRIKFFFDNLETLFRDELAALLQAGFSKADALTIIENVLAPEKIGSAIKDQFDKIKETTQTSIQEIQQLRDTGSIGEFGARRRVAEAYRVELAALQELLVAYKRLGADDSTSRLNKQWQELNQRIAEATRLANAQRQAWDDLRVAAREGLEKGIHDSITTIIEDVRTLEEAVKRFAKALLGTLLEFAATSISQELTEGLFSLFKGGGQGQLAKASKDLGAAGSILQSALPLVAGAGEDLTAGGVAVGGAAAAIATATPPLLGAALALQAAASALLAASTTTAANSGLQFLSTIPFAHGGPVWGPGTSTSDSIPARLSRGEYVLNARAVRYLGVDFLNALNGIQRPVTRRPRYRYATGGIVTTGHASNSQVDVRLGLEDGLVLRQLESKGGQRATVRTIQNHRKAIREVLR